MCGGTPAGEVHQGPHRALHWYTRQKGWSGLTFYVCSRLLMWVADGEWVPGASLGGHYLKGLVAEIKIRRLRLCYTACWSGGRGKVLCSGQECTRTLRLGLHRGFKEAHQGTPTPTVVEELAGNSGNVGRDVRGLLDWGFLGT